VVLLAPTVAEPIELEGCANFRDVGGVATATGAHVRSRRLFRSNALVAATPGDRRRLADLRIATVIDLRTDAEVAFADDPVLAGATRHHLPLGDLLGEGDAWERWCEPDYVAGRYFEICLAGAASITEAFAVLTDPSAYPVVVQCSLGKDRTGVLVALLLRAIGVPMRAIVEEYALSRRGAARIVDALHEQLDDAHCAALAPYLPALLAADPRTMLCFLGRVDDEFGSITGYLRHLDIVSAIPFLGAALLV
jgi:protein-tyrosine phosphatase